MVPRGRDTSANRTGFGHCRARTRAEGGKPTMKKLQFGSAPAEAAGNGLLDRCFLLRTGALVGFLPAFTKNEALAEPSQLAVPEWSKIPGSPFVEYGQPSKFEANVVRT